MESTGKPPLAAQKMAGLSVDASVNNSGDNGPDSGGSFLLPTPTRTPTTFQPEISPRLGGSNNNNNNGNNNNGNNNNSSGNGNNNGNGGGIIGAAPTSFGAVLVRKDSGGGLISNNNNNNNNNESSSKTEIGEELVAKHPLHHSWALWFDNPGGKRVSADKWKANLKLIAMINTVEDFWGTINNIKPPSRLASGSNYRFFKRGILPMWEEPENKRGGKWVHSLPKKVSNPSKGGNSAPNSVDEMWLELLMGCIGEQMGGSVSTMCGAILHVRKSQDRIVCWTRQYQDEENNIAVGQSMKRLLKITNSLQYVAHVDELAEGPVKPRFEV